MNIGAGELRGAQVGLFHLFGTNFAALLARIYISLVILWLGQANSALSQELPMSFDYKADHFPGVVDFRFVYADGVITQGTAQRFADFVKEKQITAGAVVILNSPGGSVSEALDMGRQIRASGFDTSLGAKDRKDGVCLSACTLTFLAGVRRTAGSNPRFGVHRVSTTTSLTVAEALELGQITVGQIVEYASYMGIKPAFVTILTQTGSREINLLSEQQMKDLSIVSAEFSTTWEIKALQSHFYALGTTTANNGIHKVIFVCAPNSGVYVQLLFNSTGEYRQSTMQWTTHYLFDFDGNEVELQNSEIISRVGESGPEYLQASMVLTKRLAQLLRNTSNLGFLMEPPSRQFYAGWHMDFAAGREKVFEYMKTCH